MPTKGRTTLTLCQKEHTPVLFMTEACPLCYLQEVLKKFGERVIELRQDVVHWAAIAQRQEDTINHLQAKLDVGSTE